MSWVCGTAATSALNPQADFRRPDAVSYTFLNQPQQAAYFRAFADDSLGSTTFADIAEQHLRRAAEDAGWSSESWHDAPVFIGSSSYAIAEYENRAIRTLGNTARFILPKICANAAATGRFSVWRPPAPRPPMR